MIEFNDVTISNRGFKILENLNLVLDDNCHYLISGKNGAGKTTLLQAIGGVAHPSTGNIAYSFINPELSWDDRYSLRKTLIHFIPTHALQSVLTTHPDFFYQQRYYTIGDVELPTVQDFLGGEKHKFDRSMFPASFNIDRLLSLELTRLSNGQLKKVLIVRELMRSIPKILLLDYPLDGLDAESRIAFCDFIDHLARTFSIQIIMTDQGNELPSVIDREIMLDNLKLSGTTAMTPGTRTRNHVASLTSAPSAVPNARDIMVEMQGVQIKYGDQVIVDNLNWKIFKGDRWALTGKNGSGKTTIFSLIFADHPMAYSQKVFLFGKRRGSGESIWDIKKRISYLGPEQLHYFNKTADGKTGRQFLQGDGDTRAADDLITHFDARFIDKKVHWYSSGELQLLLLMKSFMSAKELLLLDEPFQFLDQETKVRVNLFLNAHLKRSVTMVMITHDSRDVEDWTQSRLHLSTSAVVKIPQ